MSFHLLKVVKSDINSPYLRKRTNLFKLILLLLIDPGDSFGAIKHTTGWPNKSGKFEKTDA